MKLALFVHDCFQEIGHSHAMIEIINNFPNSEIESLEIISFTSDDPNVLFPELKGRVSFTKVPLPNLYPFIFKMIFYHLWTWGYSKYFLSKEIKKIGIGIASMNAQYINVQFVHSQWNDYFLKHKKLNPLVFFYKKILFWYFNFCERLLYSKKEIRLAVLSKFVTEFCQKSFGLNSHQIKTVYSGVNLEKYQIVQLEKEELFNRLCKSYSQLKTLDITKPIFLFVGAYERKGLPTVLEKLQEHKNSQLIVVGEPDSTSQFFFPDNIDVVTIRHTKELPSFYSLADIFVFPTSYEPFGLVITEAVAMGLEVYVTEKNVGATELLHNLDKVHICHTPKDLKILEPRSYSLPQKNELRGKRIQKLKQYSWEKAGKEFYEVLLS